MTTLAKKSPYSADTYTKNAEMYKVMANPKRLEILNLLRRYPEMTVSEFVAAMGAAKANISQHLAVLRHFRLVGVRREGTSAFYRITDPGIVETCRVLKDLRAKSMIP